MAKCFLLCSSSNSCLQWNPREILFLFSTLDIFITRTCREALCFISRQFILGTDNQPHALALPPTFIWEPQSGVAHPGTCWETQALGCGRKAGGTTRINNSASTRNPKVRSVQSHPEIKIWEPPDQHLPANCTSAAPCPLSKAQRCGSAMLWLWCDQDTLTTHTQPPKHVFLL